MLLLYFSDKFAKLLTGAVEPALETVPMSEDGTRRFSSEKEIERHFFRNLENARELRHNPIVAALFERFSAFGRTESEQRIAGEIREAVRESARTLLADPQFTPLKARRYHDLVVRCDLEGAPHKIVAADFALCERQFYRERAIATRTVLEHVRCWVEREMQGNAHAVDVFSIELHRAESLRQTGYVVHAASHLEDLARFAPHGWRKALALSHLAETNANLRNFAKAHNDIQDAQRELEAAESRDPGTRDLAAASIALSAALLAETEGNISPIGELCESVLERAQTSRAGNTGNELRAIAARAGLLQVSVCDADGDKSGAAGFLRNSRRLLDESSHIAPSLTAEYFRRALDHYVNSGAARSMVVDTYTRSLRIVESNGLIVEAARVISIYAAYLSMHGEIEDARSCLQQCFAMKSLANTHTYTDLLLASADVEASPKGDPHATIALAQQCRTQTSPGTLNWANALLLEAMARMKVADYAAVVQPISEALEIFKNLSLRHFVGVAMRILGEALHKLGKLTEAKSMIGDAVDQLRERGNPHQLYLAYRASAVITRSRAHAREARRLRRAL